MEIYASLPICNLFFSGGYRGGGRNHRDIRHENGHSSGSGFQAPAAIIDEDETWD